MKNKYLTVGMAEENISLGDLVELDPESGRLRKVSPKVVTPSSGEVCPCCKRKMPMTAAQRKRKQRAKQKQVN